MNVARNAFRKAGAQDYVISQDSKSFPVPSFNRPAIRDRHTTGTIPAAHIIGAFYSSDEAIVYEKLRSDLLVEREHFKTIIALRSKFVAEGRAEAANFVKVTKYLRNNETVDEALARVKSALKALEDTPDVSHVVPCHSCVNCC